MIDKFVGYVQNRKNNADAKWWAKVITAVLVLVVIVVVGFRLAAKNWFLRVQKARVALADHKAGMELYKVKDKQKAEKQLEHMTKARQAADKAVEIEKKLTTVSEAAKTDKEIISSIRSWDDYDKKVR